MQACSICDTNIILVWKISSQPFGISLRNLNTQRGIWSDLSISQTGCAVTRADELSSAASARPSSLTLIRPDNPCALFVSTSGHPSDFTSFYCMRVQKTLFCFFSVMQIFSTEGRCLSAGKRGILSLSWIKFSAGLWYAGTFTFSSAITCIRTAAQL